MICVFYVVVAEAAARELPFNLRNCLVTCESHHKHTHSEPPPHTHTNIVTPTHFHSLLYPDMAYSLSLSLCLSLSFSLSPSPPPNRVPVVPPTITSYGTTMSLQLTSFSVWPTSSATHTSAVPAVSLTPPLPTTLTSLPSGLDTTSRRGRIRGTHIPALNRGEGSRSPGNMCTCQRSNSTLLSLNFDIHVHVHACMCPYSEHCMSTYTCNIHLVTYGILEWN